MHEVLEYHARYIIRIRQLVQYITSHDGFPSNWRTNLKWDFYPLALKGYKIHDAFFWRGSKGFSSYYRKG